MNPATKDARPSTTAGNNAPPLLEMSRVFSTVGSFTFGGGSATIAALEREIVEKRQWLGPDRFALCFALSRMTPGTNLLAFCVAAGASLRGAVGVVLTLIAASVPCSMIAVALTMGFADLDRTAWFHPFLSGVIAAAIGSLVSTAWLLLRPSLKRSLHVRTTIILLAALTLNLGLGVSAITVLALSALTGWFWREASE
ncbi:MAG TPA: chromate transporter [Terriglobia bacterium]|nr:chromate transporter [Terriglobia bacterium]